jgi:hypothetical protein
MINKLAKVNDNFTVYRYDNGYMLEIGGQDADNEWVESKTIFVTQEELLNSISKILNLPTRS